MRRLVLCLFVTMIGGTLACVRSCFNGLLSTLRKFQNFVELHFFDTKRFRKTKDFRICFLLQSSDEHVVINVVIVNMFHPLLLSSKRTTKMRIVSINGFVALCQN